MEKIVKTPFIKSDHKHSSIILLFLSWVVEYGWFVLPSCYFYFPYKPCNTIVIKLQLNKEPKISLGNKEIDFKLKTLLLVGEMVEKGKKIDPENNNNNYIKTVMIKAAINQRNTMYAITVHDLLLFISL